LYSISFFPKFSFMRILFSRSVIYLYNWRIRSSFNFKFFDDIFSFYCRFLFYFCAISRVLLSFYSDAVKTLHLLYNYWILVIWALFLSINSVIFFLFELFDSLSWFIIYEASFYLIANSFCCLSFIFQPPNSLQFV